MQNKISWVRFDWDLARIQNNLAPPPDYALRPARYDDVDAIIRLVLSAYRSDPTWQPTFSDLETRLTERIRTTFGIFGVHYLLVSKCTELVAVSAVAKDHWTDQNLLTGICVSATHQRRGLGGYLLNRSLWRLKEMHLPNARVYTAADSLADRKLYPKFGSIRTQGVTYRPSE